MSRLDAADRVYAPIELDPEQNPAVCVWFANCTNPANGLREHPVLGPVPLCQRCDDWCERMSQ